jgi:hypothetical protein
VRVGWADWGREGRWERRREEARVKQERLRELHPISLACRFQVPWLESLSIAVSNNIDEEELARLAQEVGWRRG